MDLEKKVIKGIMEFLDGQEGEKLKKHPKLMALNVEKVEPEALEAESSEPVDEEKSEDLTADDLTPEMIKKLLAMHENMK